MRIHFGEFALDRDTRQLVRGDEELHLGPKAFDFLDFLISPDAAGRLAGAIRDRLWPGTFISESTLATVVNEVRAALGTTRDAPLHPDRPGPRIRVSGETSSAAADAPPSPRRGASFHLVLEDREVTLHEGENLLGRVEDGVLWLDGPMVSRRHARVVVAGGDAVLEDLGSKNGTFLKGERLSAPVSLSDGDVIWLGQVAVTFRVLAAGGPTRTAR